MSLLKYFGKAKASSASQPSSAFQLQAPNQPTATLSPVRKKRCIELDTGPIQQQLFKDLPKERPIREYLSEYPKTVFGKAERSFSSKWFQNREWLEYIKEADACLCFACRVYSKNDGPFSTTGFRNWKSALEAGTKPKGFAKHALSTSHVEAMKLWAEHKNRENTKSSVDTLVLKKLPEHRIWLQAVFYTIRYLVVNGLPFRGDNENRVFNSDSFGGGVYLNTFKDLLFQLQPELKLIAEKLPGNAKYTSPDIQNEVIEVLHGILKSKIAKDVKKAEYFTIMADGSSDKCLREIEGIVVRYINKDKKIEEHAINVVEVKDRSAKGLLELLLASLNENDIDCGGIVSQCYDGASVMSGIKGGLRKLLSDKCGRSILYVHCYCHKLHLVINAMINNLREAGDHYALVKCLYDCLKLKDVREKYNGLKLKRLLDTRWSGHFDCVKIINSEIKQIVDCLRECSRTTSVTSEHRITCKGLYDQVCNPFFIVLNKFLCEFLETVNIASQVLQSSNCNMSNVLEVINECRQNVSDMRSIYSLSKISSDLHFLEASFGNERRPQRDKSIPSQFEEFVVDAPVPSSNNEYDDAPKLRRVVVDITTAFEEEMCVRFAETNTKVWSSMNALLPNDPKFCDISVLTPLFEYLLTIPRVKAEFAGRNIELSNLECECKVFKHIILSHCNRKETNDIGNIFEFLLENYEVAAPALTMVYRIALACGYSSARVECLFSSMTYIDAPRRRRSTPFRECALTHLFFEKNLTREISFDEFSVEWLRKPRSLFF